MNGEPDKTISILAPVPAPWEAWRDDRLERFRLAAYLNTVISSINHPFVINLSAPYGTGKTFFLRNWQRQILDEGGRVVYLNASETELSGDPIIALVSAFRTQVIKAGGVQDIPSFDALIEEASPYILRNEQRAGAGASARLDQHDAVMHSMHRFRSGLVQFVGKMMDAEPDPRRRKIILLIDELDRCRPAYLLELLECLRHVFLVPGIIAVLAADQNYLHQAVSGVYGGEAGGEGYLRKFIDWELALPDPSYRVFARHLYDTFRVGEAGVFVPGRDPFRGEDHLIEGFAFFADVCSLTLRQQHHCFTQINIATRGMGKDSKPFGFLLGSLTALRMGFGGDIQRYCTGQRPVNELIREIEAPGMDKIANHLRMGWHDFKARFHAWFLTSDEAAIMQAEKAEIEREIKAMIDSRVMNSRELPLKNRLGYLEAVLKTYDSLRRDGSFSSHESPAYSVFKDLEHALFLSEASSSAQAPEAKDAPRKERAG